MKKDNITITRTEYEYLNKAANAAVEHACELFQAARLVDELKARITDLEKERDALKNRIDDLEFEVITLTTDVRSVESDAYFFKERWEEAEDHLERAEADWDEMCARIERVRLYGRNITYAAKYRRNDCAMGEESATNFILSILDGENEN